ncbi:hypothetical protein QM201_15360 [Enterobacter asburiae]|nr:hypothetical protein [Enterobacter asburiae]
MAKLKRYQERHMVNPGFVTREALAGWYDVPALLPQFQFYKKSRAVIETNSPEKFLPLVAEFDIQQDPVIDVSAAAPAEISAQSAKPGG